MEQVRMMPAMMEVKINRNSKKILYCPRGRKFLLPYWYKHRYGALLYSKKFFPILPGMWVHDHCAYNCTYHSLLVLELICFCGKFSSKAIIVKLFINGMHWGIFDVLYVVCFPTFFLLLPLPEFFCTSTFTLQLAILSRFKQLEQSGISLRLNSLS